MRLGDRIHHLLPLHIMAAEPVKPGSGSSPGLEPKQQPLKAMIVDDELLVAWHLEALLADLGHEVCAVASHVDAALCDFAEFLPDLVFMDVNLGPGLNGIDVARRFRSQREVPIIFVTAYTDPKTKSEMAQAAAGCVVLAKPVTSGDIAQAIEVVTGSQH